MNREQENTTEALRYTKNKIRAYRRLFFPDQFGRDRVGQNAMVLNFKDMCSVS